MKLHKFLKFFFVGIVIIVIAGVQTYLYDYSHLPKVAADLLALPITVLGGFACFKVLTSKKEGE